MLPLYHRHLKKSLKRGVGTSKEKETKSVPLYDLNTSYLNRLNDMATDLDVAYTSSLFGAVNRPISIDGEVIPLSELSTAMKNPDLRSKLILAAGKIQNDPSLDPDVKWNAIMNSITSYQIQASIPYLNKKMGEQLYYSAEYVDTRNKYPETNLVIAPMGGAIITHGDVKYNKELPHTGMFKKDDSGSYQMLSPEEYAVAYINNSIYNNNAKIAKERAEYEKKGFPKRTFETSAVPQRTSDYDRQNLLKFISDEPGTWGPTPLKQNQNKYDPSFLWKNSQQKTGSQEPINVSERNGILPTNQRGSNINKQQAASRKNQESEFWRMSDAEDFVTLENVTKDWRYEQALKIYEKNKKSILNRYNESNNTEVYKLSADLENKFRNNKGGEEKAEPSVLEFNLNDPGKKQNGEFIPNPGFAQYVELERLVNTDDGDIIYDFGKVKSEVPDKEDVKSNDVKMLFKMMGDDLALIQKFNKREGAKLPHGSITFQGIVGGDDKYHAYNVVLNSNYLGQRDLKGSEENPGIAKTYPELQTDGFTIYVPAQKSEKMTTAGRYLKHGKILSPTEVLLSLKNDVTIPIPGAGQITLSRDPVQGTITLGRYRVTYNPETSKIDTVSLSPKVFGLSQVFDIDQYLEKELTDMKAGFFFNEQMKKQTLELKGVKDPKQLQPQ